MLDAIDPALVARAHLVVTAFLCGLIWVVELVHYPLFARVGAADFAAYEAEHCRRINWIVAPAMGFEALSGALWLVLAWRSDDRALLALGNALGIVAIWAITALLAMPQHARLARGFDPAAHRRLLRANTLRTALWTLRTLALASC